MRVQNEWRFNPVAFPVNIGHIKLIDFGLSKLVKLGERAATICGTLQYMGEMVKGFPSNQKKSKY